MNALRSGDPAAVGAALVNDLQPAALDLQPRLRQVLDAGLGVRRAGRAGVWIRPDLRFSGGQRGGGRRSERGLSADGQCRAVRRATGPVTGARVIG